MLVPTDVPNLIKKLPNKLTQGLDQIPCKILKFCQSYISTPLSDIINSSFSSGIFPDKLKISKVIPLFKKGDNLDPSNYRPISLPSSFSKILENAYLSQFTNHLIINNLISKSQHAFFKGRSTTTATFELLSEIFSNLDQKLDTIGLFYDLKFAFDSIDYVLLFSKLKSLGVDDSELSWIKSYLTGRKQQVEITTINKDGLKSKVYSDTRNVFRGAPQGSSSGPILFNCYINDLPNSFPLGLLIIYADDSNNIISAPSSHLLFRNSQLAISYIENWTKENFLILHPKKTTFVQFHPHQKIIDQSPLLKLNGHTIQSSMSTTFLGIILDDTLNWHLQCNAVASKLKSSIFLLRSLHGTVSPNILLLVYYAHVYSHIQYSVLFWGLSHHSKRIFTLQKQAIRVMLGLGFNESCTNAFKNYKILTVPSIFILQCSLFVKKHPHYFPLNSAIHKYNTRQAGSVHIPRDNLCLNNSNPKRSASIIYNALPNKLKTINDYVKFKRELTSYLQEKCYYSIYPDYYTIFHNKTTYFV